MKILRAVLVAAMLAAVLLVVPGQPAGAQPSSFGFGYTVEAADDCFIDAPLAGLTDGQTTDNAKVSRLSLFVVQIAQIECVFDLEAADVTPPGGFAAGFDCLVPVDVFPGAQWNTNISTFSVAPRDSGGYRGILRCTAIIPFDAILSSSVGDADAGAA